MKIVLPTAAKMIRLDLNNTRPGQMFVERETISKSLYIRTESGFTVIDLQGDVLEYSIESRPVFNSPNRGFVEVKITEIHVREKV